MKKRLFLSLTTFAILSACSSSESPTLNTSQSSYSVTSEAQNLEINVASNTAWTISSVDSWCIPSVTSGTGDTKLNVAVSENPTTTSRQDSLKFLYSSKILPVMINQAAAAPKINLSAASYDVAYNNEYQIIKVSSNTSWTVSSDEAWCTPAVTNGSGNASLLIRLTGNTTTSARTATLVFLAGSATTTTKITQTAGTGSEYHYKIPVVFHVLYKDTTDSLQYVKNNRLKTIIAAVNQLYNNNNINLEFEMAPYDASGNTLAEPGIDRQQISTATLDCEKFMNGALANNSVYLKMLWNLNYYINIYLYNFKEDDSGYTTMGITHMPYMSPTYPLNGLTTSNYYLTHSWDYPHCSSINSLYIYEESTSKTYNPMDVVVTIAHELGHYLGLDHVFTETGENTCSGTDYCDDTPNYDRTTYENWLSNLISNAKKNGTTLALKDVVVRTACDGSTFNAHNIMDYEYCYSDEFTANQRTRIRYVLNYGLFQPGPKYNSSSNIQSRSVDNTHPRIIYKSVNVSNKTMTRMRGIK